MTMPPQERYGAGQTVYSNGKHNPTDGTVDPMGFIDRELNKMSPQSNKRSGLAAAALDRLGSKNAPANSTPGNPISDYSDPYLGTPPTLRPLASVGDFTIDAIGQLNPVPPAPPIQMQPQLGQQIPGQVPAPASAPVTPSNGVDPSVLAQAAMARLGGTQ